MGEVMIKVSVIVPVYNAEKYLKDCLESLINQTLKDIEIICINDDSTDYSSRIIKEYQEKDRRVKVICNENNIGAAESRNKGISIAAGKYIQFVDADDYLELNSLEKMYVMAENLQLDMCYLGMQFEPESILEEQSLQQSIIGKYEGIFCGKKLIRLFTENKEFFLYLCSVFYRSSFIQENELRYKKLIVGEGGNYILRALCLAERVAVCMDKLYHYRINAASVTHGENAKEELLLGQIVQYIDVLQYFTNHEDAEELELFLEVQYRKIAGGIQSLSSHGEEEIECRLETNYAKHIFHMLQQKNNVYGIKFDDEILLRIRKKQKVIIYGAGYATKEMLELMQKYEIEIMGFAVTKRKKETMSVFGHHIYEIEELLPYKNAAIILVAANKKFNHEIKNTLDKYGFSDYIFLNVEI